MSIESNPSFLIADSKFKLHNFLVSLLADTKRLIIESGSEGQTLNPVCQSLQQLVTGYNAYSRDKKKFLSDARQALNLKDLNARYNALPIMLQGFYALDGLHALSIYEFLAIPPVPDVKNEIDKKFILLLRNYMLLLKKKQPL